MTKKTFVWLAISLGYFVTRIANLGVIPIFTDEAIYLRWSQIISGDLSYLYLPLSDGKPPLFMWVVAVFMKIFSNVDPVLVGRFVSVLAGYLALLGIHYTSFQLFKNKELSLLAVLFYLISPFTFFYDRFALADSMLAMFGIWSLGIGVVMVRTLKWKYAVLVGLIIGFGWLTKTPAQFFWALLPTLVIFSNFSKKSLLKIGLMILLAIGIARCMYMILYFLPQAYVMSLKNYEFIIPLRELLKHPFLFVWGNAQALMTWEINYLTIPVSLLVAVSLIAGIFQKSWVKLILLTYFGSLFVFMCFFNKVIYPRFLLMFTPMLLILAASGFYDLAKLIKSKVVISLLLIGFLLLPSYTIYKLITDPINAPIADNDSNQYINSWSAGWGVREVNAFLLKEAKNNSQITIGTEGTFGLMPYGLELYQPSNISIKSYWPPPTNLPAEIIQVAKSYPTYYLIYQRASYPQEWKLELLAAYRQGNSNDFLKLYKVPPDN